MDGNSNSSFSSFVSKNRPSSSQHGPGQTHGGGGTAGPQQDTSCSIARLLCHYTYSGSIRLGRATWGAWPPGNAVLGAGLAQEVLLGQQKVQAKAEREINADSAAPVAMTPRCQTASLSFSTFSFLSVLFTFWGLHTSYGSILATARVLGTVNARHQGVSSVLYFHYN